MISLSTLKRVEALRKVQSQESTDHPDNLPQSINESETDDKDAVENNNTDLKILWGVDDNGKPTYAEYPIREKIMEYQAEKVIEETFKQLKDENNDDGGDAAKIMEEMNKWPFDEAHSEIIKAAYQMRQLVNVCVLLDSNDKFSISNVSKGFPSTTEKMKQTLISARKQRMALESSAEILKKCQSTIKKSLKGQEEIYQRIYQSKFKWKIVKTKAFNSNGFGVDLSLSDFRTVSNTKSEIGHQLELGLRNEVLFSPTFTGDAFSPITEPKFKTVLKQRDGFEEAFIDLTELTEIEFYLMIKEELQWQEVACTNIAKYKTKDLMIIANNMDVVFDSLQSHEFMEELWTVLTEEMKEKGNLSSVFPGKSTKILRQTGEESNNPNNLFVKTYTHEELSFWIDGSTVVGFRKKQRKVAQYPPKGIQSSKMKLFLHLSAVMLKTKLRQLQSLKRKDFFVAVLGKRPFVKKDFYSTDFVFCTTRLFAEITYLNQFSKDLEDLRQAFAEEFGFSFKTSMEFDSHHFGFIWNLSFPQKMFSAQLSLEGALIRMRKIELGDYARNFNMKDKALKKISTTEELVEFDTLKLRLRCFASLIAGFYLK